MKVGHKRDRCHGCKYSFAKCKINTKINTHITTQIESLNSLVFLITKEIIHVFSDSLNVLTAFMRKVSSSPSTT